MPGKYVPAPSVAASWSRAEWVDYRAKVLACAGRADSADWWKNVGKQCVTMADRNIERLGSSESAV